MTYWPNNIDDVLKRDFDPKVAAGLLAQQVKDERARIFTPLSGPQTEAFHCTAFETLYGGAAGSGSPNISGGSTVTKPTSKSIPL